MQGTMGCVNHALRLRQDWRLVETHLRPCYQSSTVAQALHDIVISSPHWQSVPWAACSNKRVVSECAWCQSSVFAVYSNYYSCNFTIYKGA